MHYIIVKPFNLILRPRRTIEREGGNQGDGIFYRKYM